MTYEERPIGHICEVNVEKRMVFGKWRKRCKICKKSMEKKESKENGRK